jgi:hypothetical protein
VNIAPGIKYFNCIALVANVLIETAYNLKKKILPKNLIKIRINNIETIKRLINFEKEYKTENFWNLVDVIFKITVSIIEVDKIREE